MKLKCWLGLHNWVFELPERQWQSIYRVCQHCKKVEKSMDCGQTWMKVARSIL